MTELKRTCLYRAHQQAGARFVDFGGWEMPVQYASIVEEHLAVRRTGGIFDISHMGEVFVTGPGAGSFLNEVLTNDTRKLTVGQAQYTLMCHDHGGVVDDLYAYRLEDQKYLLILNASRIDADWDWLQSQLDRSQVADGVQVKNASSELGAVAIQGPRMAPLVDQVIAGGSLAGKIAGRASDLQKNEVGAFLFQGVPLYLARTGYTGEDGFEVVAPAAILETLWHELLLAGRSAGLQPAGLGARDTLRTEMGYPLYGQELSESITPLEAGLAVFVALDKGQFVGRQALLDQKTKGLTRKSAAFVLVEKAAPPRPHYVIWNGETPVGEVTSGTQSPSLNKGIGMGLLPIALAKPGQAIAIEIRGRKHAAQVVRKPIYQRL